MSHNSLLFLFLFSMTLYAGVEEKKILNDLLWDIRSNSDCLFLGVKTNNLYLSSRCRQNDSLLKGFAIGGAGRIYQYTFIPTKNREYEAILLISIFKRDLSKHMAIKGVQFVFNDEKSVSLFLDSFNIKLNEPYVRLDKRVTIRKMGKTPELGSFINRVVSTILLLGLDYGFPSHAQPDKNAK